jgi:hypothetical protein
MLQKNKQALTAKPAIIIVIAATVAMILSRYSAVRLFSKPESLIVLSVAKGFCHESFIKCCINKTFSSNTATFKNCSHG